MNETTIPRFGRTLRWLLVVGSFQALLLSFLEGGLVSAKSGRSANRSEASSISSDQTITIDLKARQFDPAQVVLTAGEPTTLTFHNLDAELHAFVPVGLLTGIHLSITGNGAPEFTENGLARLIIPPDGTATIHFVPQRPGTYPYFCDMPGHSMRGMVEVKVP